MCRAAFTPLILTPCFLEEQVIIHGEIYKQLLTHKAVGVKATKVFTDIVVRRLFSPLYLVSEH